ncbi:MAG: membrane protein insertase YidC, partial [Bdellovibrionota bacterium]
MTDPNKPSFMDRSTILAFLIVLVFWFGWSKFMESRYPAQDKPASAQGTDQPAATNVVGATAGPNTTTPTQTTAAAPGAPVVAISQTTSNEEFIQFSDDTWEFQVSTFGMGLSGIHLKKYKTRDEGPIRFAEAKGESAFATRLPPYQAPLVFTVERTALDTFVGRASADGTQIEKTLKINSATYSVETTVKITGAVKGVATRMADVVPPHVPSSFFAPHYDFLSWFVRHDDTSTRTPIDAEQGAEVAVSNASVVGLSAHYFALAVVDRSPLLPRFESKIPGKAPVAAGQLVYEPASPLEALELKYSAFAGPKDFDLLLKIDEKATQIIDYGMFAFIGKPMVWLLKYLYSVFLNWGVAIIFLTLIVRTLVMPFTIYSYK